MSQTAEQTTVRYRGATFMSGRDVNLIVSNDTRTEPVEEYAVPSPQRTGHMSTQEANDVVQDGWTPVREHRRPDPHDTTLAVAEVVSPVFTVVEGSVRAGDSTVPHLGKRVGRRLVLMSEGTGVPYKSVQARRSKQTVQPADLPHVSVRNLRSGTDPDTWQKGIPTERSLRRIGQPVINAMQFVLEKGADLLFHIHRDPEQFVKANGADTTRKIRKAPLRSMRHEEQQRRSARREKPKAEVSADGVFF